MHDSMRSPSHMLCLAACGTHLPTILMHSQPHERLKAPDGPASNDSHERHEQRAT